jgi:hypothetical protein
MLRDAVIHATVIFIDELRANLRRFFSDFGERYFDRSSLERRKKTSKINYGLLIEQKRIPVEFLELVVGLEESSKLFSSRLGRHRIHPAIRR